MILYKILNGELVLKYSQAHTIFVHKLVHLYSFNLKIESLIQYYIDNVDNLSFTEVSRFSATLDARVNEHIAAVRKLQTEFRQRIGQKKNSERNCVQRVIGGLHLEFPLIATPEETRDHPNEPCALEGVNNWLFIFFQQLDQIIPVRESFSFFTQTQSSHCTKINYGLFKDIPLEHFSPSFAAIPFTSATWRKFQSLPTHKWENYLHQLNIDWRASQKLPLRETVGMKEIARTLTPEAMAPQWSLFVQLYFVLYLFRRAGSPEHFCL